MPIGQLPYFEEATDKPLQIDVAFWADRAKTEAVEIAEATAWLRKVGGEGYLEASAALSRLTIEDNIVLIRVPKVDMELLPPGQYDFAVLVTDAAGGAHEQRGRVALLAGLGE